jgi:hypothetical protein
MPLTGDVIGAQTGAAAGLWTHTPVDWRGNEGVAQPGGWPANASGAVPPLGNATPSPFLSAISVSAILATTATVNWTVNPSAVSFVDYGTTVAYGSSSTSDTGAGARTKGLTGLTTATLYHYRIRSTANGQTVSSADGTFTTA